MSVAVWVGGKGPKGRRWEGGGGGGGADTFDQDEWLLSWSPTARHPSCLVTDASTISCSSFRSLAALNSKRIIIMQRNTQTRNKIYTRTTRRWITARRNRKMWTQTNFPKVARNRSTPSSDRCRRQSAHLHHLHELTELTCSFLNLSHFDEISGVTWPQLPRDWRFSDHVTSADKRVQWASETSVDVGIELNFPKFLCLELEGRGEIC